MRVLIDEDTAVQLLEPLRCVLPRHRVDHITEIKWQGKKDRPVLADAKRARYDVFLTKDHNQLADPGECDAIRKSGLHHITYSQRRPGTAGLGLALGAVIAAMPLVMEALELTAGQQLVHITGLDPTRRFAMTDPSINPPNYWPR
jgi:hypothetical protein